MTRLAGAMRRAGLAVLLCLVPAVAATLAPGGTLRLLQAVEGPDLERVALVVGNSAYRYLDPLPQAVVDARSVAETARRLGYDVHLVEDAGGGEMERAIGDFLAAVGPASEALVYYAGHAVEFDGANHLLPVDMPKLTPFEDRLLRTDSVGLAALLRDLGARAPRSALVVLDASRDNPFAGFATGLLGSPRGLGGVDPPEGAIVISAAGPGETAPEPREDDGPGGLFARKLVGLMERDGLGITDLVRELRREVSIAAATASDAQMPTSFGELEADFHFRPEAALTRRAEADAGGDGAEAEPSLERAPPVESLPPLQPGPAEAEAEAEVEVAAVPPPPETTEEPAEPDRALITALQKKLADAGCYSGGIDGIWGGGSRNAVREFGRHAGVQIASTEPSADLLEVLRPTTRRVCPLTCGRGFEVKGDRCVAVQAPAAPAPAAPAPAAPAPAAPSGAQLEAFLAPGKQAPAPAPAPGGRRYGAVCISNSGGVAAASGRASAAEASNAARGKGGCAYVMEISGSLCFALAKANAPRSGFPLFKAATRSGEGSARSAAQQLCEQPGQKCDVAFSICAGTFR
ncbi:MAG TPA: caspase family protein [Thermohalobaculum sp.]|nr:caspase family protein [Thermohalobaculum sp.]